MYYFSLTLHTFKDYVDMIELLNSPGECQRLQNEVPEVHEDLNMDARHQSKVDSRLPFHTKHCMVLYDKTIKFTVDLLISSLTLIFC